MTGSRPRLLTRAHLSAAPPPSRRRSADQRLHRRRLSGPQVPLDQDQYDAFMMVVERNGGKLGGVPVQVLRGTAPSRPTQIVQA